jgi:hypothetical protein
VLRVKSLIFNWRHSDTTRPLEDVQFDLASFCRRHAHLSQIHLRVMLSAQVDLRPLSQLRHLRMFRFRPALQDEEQGRTERLPRDIPLNFLYRLIRSADDDDDAAPSSSNARDRAVTTYPSVEEITIDGEDLAHIRVKKDAELPDLMAVAFPHLRTLRFNHAGFQLALPLTGVFHQLRYLAWCVTPSHRGEVDVPVEDTLRQLLGDLPLLESLHLNEWWREDYDHLQSSYNGLLPLVCASPKLRRVSLVPSFSEERARTRVHQQSHLRLIRFHLLWRQIDSTHRVPEEGMDDLDATSKKWTNAMRDGLSMARACDRVSDPSAPLEASPSSWLRWFTTALRHTGSVIQQLAKAMEAPAIDPTNNRRAIVEAESALRARIPAEVRASGREVTHRPFEFVLIES